MPEKPAKSADVVKINTETILQTTEGRIFLNHINEVSRVLSMRDAEVEFKGEEIVKTGYVGDCKSVQVFKCPSGYFVFADMAFGMNNWSASGKTMDEVLAKISNDEVRKHLREEVSQVAVVEEAHD